MTKEEYGDFVLRYKGCGACFPMYHTLSRFEKMWFSAIQKDVADIEKENAELKAIVRNTKAVDESFALQTIQLTKAKEIILRLYNAVRDVLMCRAEEKAYDNLSNAINDKSIEQFISEVEK